MNKEVMNKEKNSAKASYHQPIFSIYGDLTKLTRQGGNGMADSATTGSMSV